jgi:hypothetical protein
MEHSRLIWTAGRLQVLAARHTVLHEAGWGGAKQPRARRTHCAAIDVVTIRRRWPDQRSPWLRGGVVLLVAVFVLVAVIY